MWYVYVLQCSDNTLYTGITKDIKKRIKEHNNSVLGAKYTRGRRPVKLLYSDKRHNKSSAAKEEFRIKKMNRQKKIHFIRMSSKI